MVLACRLTIVVIYPQIKTVVVNPLANELISVIVGIALGVFFFQVFNRLSFMGEGDKVK
jgi:hypothetical protein